MRHAFLLPRSHYRSAPHSGNLFLFFSPEFLRCFFFLTPIASAGIRCGRFFGVCSLSTEQRIFWIPLLQDAVFTCSPVIVWRPTRLLRSPPHPPMRSVSPYYLRLAPNSSCALICSRFFLIFPSGLYSLPSVPFFPPKLLLRRRVLSGEDQTLAALFFSSVLVGRSFRPRQILAFGPQSLRSGASPSSKTGQLQAFIVLPNISCSFFGFLAFPPWQMEHHRVPP